MSNQIPIDATEPRLELENCSTDNLMAVENSSHGRTFEIDLEK
jgi:hypothetical protein